MRKKLEIVVIDNDTQEIFVNGKKWEPSPPTYSFLNIFRRQPEIKPDPEAAAAFLDYAIEMHRKPYMGKVQHG